MVPIVQIQQRQRRRRRRRRRRRNEDGHNSIALVSQNTTAIRRYPSVC